MFALFSIRKTDLPSHSVSSTEASTPSLQAAAASCTNNNRIDLQTSDVGPTLHAAKTWTMSNRWKKSAGQQQLVIQKC